MKRIIKGTLILTLIGLICSALLYLVYESMEDETASLRWEVII